MMQNFKKEHRELALKDKVKAAAKATYINKFVYEMETLKELDEQAFKWVQQHTTPKNWTRSHFSTKSKCDTIVNNICECFNKVLLPAREKAIMGLLEAIRFYLMARMESKRVWMSRLTGELCPKIVAKLENNKKYSNACIATHAGELAYEIRCMYGEQFVVNLRKRTCSCRRWDLNGIPCSHAISAINRLGEKPESFVDQCYSREAYLKAYEPVIFPLNGPNLWKKVSHQDILPPEAIKLPGRPKKARKKDAIETRTVREVQKLSRAGRMTYKCRLCHAEGHNSRKCPTKTNESQSRGSQASMSFGDSNSTMQPPIPTQEIVTSTSNNPTKVRI